MNPFPADMPMLQETFGWLGLIFLAVVLVVALWMLLEHAESWLRGTPTVEPAPAEELAPEPEPAKPTPTPVAIACFACSTCHKHVEAPVHTIEQMLHAVSGNAECASCTVFFAAHESEVS